MTFGGAQPLPKPNAGDDLEHPDRASEGHPRRDNPTLRARNLKVLFALPGGVEQLIDGMPIRKGPPVPFDDIAQAIRDAGERREHEHRGRGDRGVGGPERVVAIPLTPEQEKRTGTLVGFVGEVDAGWKLFPLHTIKVIKPSMRKIE